MKRSILVAVLAGVLGLLAAGCSSSGGLVLGPPMMTGRVEAVAGKALPSAAVLTVRLLDVTRVNEPAIVLVERSISSPGAFPIHFELPYPAGGVTPGRHFVIQARIEVSGQLRYYSKQPGDVTPQNAAQPHVVRMEPVRDDG